MGREFLNWLHRTGPLHWCETDKADPRAVALADRHYSRRSRGSAFFTRPGYNMTLLAYDEDGGEALFNWWRPKFPQLRGEGDGPGRKDGLLAIECTHFRNESRILSSLLIEQAVSVLQCWRYACPAKVITSVNADATAARRSRKSKPGHCFLEAGWAEFEKPGSHLVWLECMRFSAPRRVERIPRGQFDLFKSAPFVGVE